VVGGGILSGLRQRVIGGIPGGVGKTDMWVVVATTMETRRKKKGNVGRWGEKLGKRTDNFPSLASDFSTLRAWNPPLFIKGGRGIFCLYWCQILVFDLNRKDSNHWFKIAIKNCQILTTQSCMSWLL
jgi:hypothetical protein